MKKEICILKIDESLAESLASDTFTFMTICLLVYISQDSTWWTLVTGVMFLVFACAKVGTFTSNKFTSTDEVRAWLDRIDIEQEQSK